MLGSGKWVVGGFVTVLGMVALFLSSQAKDSGMYLFGLIFFAASVIFVFSLIGHFGGHRGRRG